jgi:small conductance mechanosensitive channel
MSEGKKYTRLIGLGISFFVLLIVAGALFYYAVNVYHIIPINQANLTELIIAAVLGYVIIIFLGREIQRISVKLLGPRRGDTIYLVFRYVGFIILALVLLSIYGVSGTDLLAGGTFAGLVIGLAGQTVLSNVISGIMLLIARPFEIGDRITFATWQFGMIAPVYPPKYYSSDLLIPGYTGKVENLGFLYSIVRSDDGPPMKIPNSVMVQAVIVSHDINERLVRTRFEIPSFIAIEKLFKMLNKKLETNEWISDPRSLKIMVNTTTLNSYVITIDALCKGAYEEPPRSSILMELISIVNQLKEEQATQTNVT